MASAICQSGDAGTFRTGNADFTFITAWFSLGCVQTHDNRTVHAGDGSDGGSSSAISRRISANILLGTVTSAIWKST